MKQRGKPPKRRSQDMHSVLFSRRSQNSVESVVVPETPTNITGARTSNATTMMSVMETPEDEQAGIGKAQSHLPLQNRKDAVNEVYKAKKGARSSSEDEINDSTLLDITPDLKLRKKNLVSILESEDSFARSLKSQRTKNSSMLFGIDNDKEADESDFIIMSPIKKNKRRRSVAQVIMPFDLNDSESLSNKLRTIEECEKKEISEKKERRKSTIGLSESRPNAVKKARDKRKSLGQVIRSSVAKSLVAPPSTDSSEDEIIFNTQKENPRYMVKHNRRQSTSYTRENSSETSLNQNKSENRTKIFDSEDLILTPIKTSSQEKSIQNIISNLESQNISETDMLEETLPVPINRVPGMSFQNFSTRSARALQVRELKNQEKEVNVRNAENANDSESGATEFDLSVVLQGVVAYVEVRMGSDNRSEVIKEQLKILGAEVRNKFTADPLITHVIFKDGSKATFNRAVKRGLYLVSSLWVEACRENLKRVPETLYPSCSIEDYKTPSFGIKKIRKQKSMQPKEFSEEERLANARALRKLKMAKSPIMENNEVFTPVAARVNEESKDSPLFGISHLLTPRQRTSNSASETEEEVVQGGSPPKYMTPLVKRLYDRFLSPRTDSSQRRRVVARGESSMNKEDIKQKLRCTTDQSSDSTDENLNNADKERLPEGSADNKGPDNRAEAGRPQNRQSPKHSSNNVSKACESSLNLLLSDSSQNQSSMLEVPPKRRVHKRNSSSSSCDIISNSSSEEGHSKRRKSQDKVAVNRVNSFISEALGNGTEKQTNKENISTEKVGGTESTAQSRKRQQSILKKEDATSRTTPQQKRKSVTYGKVDVLEVKPQEQLLSTPVKNLNSRVPSAVGSPACGESSSQPSCSIPASQRGHRLLNLDLLAPSQDLIVPSTPEDPKKFLRRPYTDLPIKGSKTQRTAMRNQKGGSLSVPLPRTSKKSKGVESSPENIAGPSQQNLQGSKAKETVPVRRSLRLKAAPVTKDQKSDDDVFFSSEDEICRFPRLPRPRRSTEEFQHRNTLIKKGRKSQKAKEDNLPSLYLTSVHSKEKKSLIPIIQKLGGFRITQDIDSTTTHIVCGEARRTLNLLNGIARGAWILDMSWVFESLDLDKWAPEEPFELFTSFPGAKVARQQKQKCGKEYTQTLFSGVGSIFVLEGCTPPSHDLIQLIELTGGKIVSQIRSANLAIGTPNAALGARSLETKVTHLSEKWVLDSIQYHKIQPFHEYLLSAKSVSSVSSEES